MTSHRFLYLAGALVALVALGSGCGSSTPAASGTTTASKGTTQQSGATDASSGSSSGGSSKSGKTIDLCSLMPAATVAQLTGEAVTTGAEDSGDKVLASSGIFNCNYTGGPGAQIDLDVTTKNAKIGYDAELQAASSVKAAGTKQVSGLGDKAFSSIDGVHALFGDVEIKVSGVSFATAAVGLNSSDPLAGAKALINAVHAKL